MGLGGGGGGGRTKGKLLEFVLAFSSFYLEEGNVCTEFGGSHIHTSSNASCVGAFVKDAF